MIKGSIIKKTTILNIYVPNKRPAKYMKQKMIELQGKIEKSTIIVNDFNTFFP